MADNGLARESDPAALEKLLPLSDDGQEPHERHRSLVDRRSLQKLNVARCAFEFVIIAIALYMWLSRSPECFASQVNFSGYYRLIQEVDAYHFSAPASEAIQYHTRIFTAGYLPGEKSEYQLDCPECKPTDEIDEAWKSLYQDRMWSRIPRHQAAQLRNYTINIPGNEDHYLIGLDVFHQLHCLDNVRKGLWPERYNPENYMGGQGMSLLSAKHLDHCIDQIRQSIMCQSDLSVNWLLWSDRFQANTGAREIEHSCRNFDRVVEWAQEHYQEPFDLSVRLHDPLRGV